jgi:hypothetical protein
VFTTNGSMSSSGVGGVAQDGSAETVKVFFNLAMMLIMLHIMIKVTKSTAGAIGEFGTNMIGKVGGFGLGAAALGGGLLARQTIGRVASAASNSKWVTDNPNGVIGKSTRLLANTSYDIGNSSVIKGALGRTGIHIGTGMGQTLGYDAAEKKRLEKRFGEYGAIGVHRKNVYNDDGTIKYKKGQRNDSPEAEAERKKYLEKGGSVFATKFEGNELREMTGQNEKSEKNKKFSEALAKYKELDDKHYDDDDAGRAQKQADRDEIKNKQDPETKERLANYEKKLEKAETDKAASKEEREAAKRGNEALVSLAETLRGGGQPQQQTTPQQVVVSPQITLQAGETLSSGGIILPASYQASTPTSSSSTTSTPVAPTAPPVTQTPVPSVVVVGETYASRARARKVEKVEEDEDRKKFDERTRKAKEETDKAVENAKNSSAGATV